MIESLPVEGANQVAADICVVGGAGHVGLPLSIVFAAKNQRVLIYDRDQNAMDVIRGGRMPFHREFEIHESPPRRRRCESGDHYDWSASRRVFASLTSYHHAVFR